MRRGVGRAAPLSYRNWYSFSEKVSEVRRLPAWSSWRLELERIDRNFPVLNLQNEAALLVSMEQNGSIPFIFINRSSVESYMKAEFPWFHFHTA